MSLPRKGLRKLKIQNDMFEWTIRKKPTYIQGALESPMILSIQSSIEEKRSVLIVNCLISRPDNWINPHQTGITPNLIKKIIIAAIKDGWNPNGDGKSYQFNYQLHKDMVYNN